MEPKKHELVAYIIERPTDASNQMEFRHFMDDIYGYDHTDYFAGDDLANQSLIHYNVQNMYESLEVDTHLNDHEMILSKDIHASLLDQFMIHIDFLCDEENPLFMFEDLEVQPMMIKDDKLHPACVRTVYKGLHLFLYIWSWLPKFKPEEGLYE